MVFILEIIFLNSSTEIKNGAYTINFDEHSDIGTHWVALYVHNNNNNNNNKHNKNIITSIFRIQAYNSITCGHFCIGFIVQIFLHQIILRKMIV